MPQIDVGKSPAVFVPASPVNRKRIVNVSGGTAFLSTSSGVSESSTSLVAETATIIDAGNWFISASTTKLEVEPLTTTATTGGVEPNVALPGVYGGNWSPVAATSGTDTAAAEKALFLTGVFLPVNKTITGIGYLVGSVGGTNKVVAGLWDSKGILLGHSSETTEGTVAGTAAEVQELSLTATFDAIGPGLYYAGITMNGNTAKLRTIPTNTAGKNIFAGEVTLAAKNVLANVTAPTTFTGNKGPVCWVF